MTPSIQTFPQTKLVSQKMTMSFPQDKTIDLCQSFPPRKKEIKNSLNDDFYSVEIYPNTSFVQNFNTTQAFEKWAAIAVSEIDEIPKGMQSLNIPEGLYAVFPYQGKPSEAMDTFRYIYA